MQNQNPIVMEIKPRIWTRLTSSRVIFGFYLVLLTICSFHLYRTPIYDMDSIQYMGNALLMRDTDPVRIHERVYSEIKKTVPEVQLDQLLGNEPGAPKDQNRSRRTRAADPYRYAEFLPLFAIRPLYNQALYYVSVTGLGLARAGVLISVGSYFFLGVLLFLWLRAYATPFISLAVSLVTMIAPPLTELGRDTTSDSLASLVAFLALYLIFEKSFLLLGTILLLSSIFFRTDFVVLAGPVLLICWLQRRIPFWQAAVLGILAAGSVLCINHFAGDYGIKMLYYRNFVGTPEAPGEIIVQFSVGDYLAAFRTGLTKVAESFFLPFLVIGGIGLQSRRAWPLMTAAAAYIALHFLILPNWQERWAAVFYLSMVVSALMPIRFPHQNTTQQPT
jgi:hypothetical protein